MESDFSRLLKIYRKGLGWTQAKMSQEWSYSFETISAWERGKRSPGSQEIPRVAKFLSLESTELAEIILSGKSLTVPSESVNQVYKALASRKSSFEMWGELLYVYKTRTDFNSDYSYARMFKGARSILAVGLSLNAISLTYNRDALTKAMLEDDCSITLCFLDPQGDNCARREKEEDHPEGMLCNLTGVNICLMESLRTQISRIESEKAQRLRILVYDLPIRFNIYIVDDTLMSVQNYGYGRGEDTPIMLLRKKTQGGLFDFYAQQAGHILDHAHDPGQKTAVAGAAGGKSI